MTIKTVSLEDMIEEFVRTKNKKIEALVHIGYFESEGKEPSYDDARVCPFCNESLVDSSRPTKTILIHCNRWPLATFIRFHTEELQGLMEVKYHEIIAQALEQRANIEENRKVVPNIFRRAFEV